jgi:hypothetical protein
MQKILDVACRREALGREDFPERVDVFASSSDLSKQEEFFSEPFPERLHQRRSRFKAVRFSPPCGAVTSAPATPNVRAKRATTAGLAGQ